MMVGGSFTVKVALLLVTLPPPFVTTTEKSAPLSAATVGGVVKEDRVAEGIFVPPLRH